MKYIVVLAGGLADEPLESLGGRTPLQAASTPALDEVARGGKIAAVRTLPASLPPSEEVALLSAAGYDPAVHFRGEAALACAAWERDLPADRIAFRYHLVTESDGLMRDHAAGHISAREAKSLLDSLAGRCVAEGLLFHTIRGFTGVVTMLWRWEGYPTCHPPETTWDVPLERCLPHGPGEDRLAELINLSREVFREHEVNRVRTDLGENPATLLWPWGPGRPVELPSFESSRGLRAAMIAAAESPRGLASLCGMALLRVEGITGGYDTNYAAKALAAIDALAQFDLAFIHIAAPHEASLDGDVQRKIRIAEAIDRCVVAPLLRFVNQNEFVRLLFMPTQATSVARRRPLHVPVAAVMYGAGLRPIRQVAYSESAVAQAEVIVERGHELLEYFLRA